MTRKDFGEALLLAAALVLFMWMFSGWVAVGIEGRNPPVPIEAPRP